MSYGNNKSESRTKYTISVEITKEVTAGVVKATAPGRLDVDVPATDDTVVNWRSEGPDLNAAIDKALRVLKLYGGTIGFIIDAPHDRGSLADVLPCDTDQSRGTERGVPFA